MSTTPTQPDLEVQTSTQGWTRFVEVPTHPDSNGTLIVAQDRGGNLRLEIVATDERGGRHVAVAALLPEQAAGLVQALEMVTAEDVRR